jgi:very-short-patch-repair endonuclease
MSIPLDFTTGSVTSPSKGEVGAQRRVGVGPRFSHTRAKTARARRLRANMTLAEPKLWSMLGGGKVAGLSFRRQHPIGEYVADFWCADARLVIEVDGSQHDRRWQRAHDEKRTAKLAQQNIKVIRIPNEEVLLNIRGVYLTILEAVEGAASTPTRPSADLPISGGGDRGQAPALGVASPDARAARMRKRFFSKEPDLGSLLPERSAQGPEWGLAGIKKASP